jgi:hypothetical protein
MNSVVFRWALWRPNPPALEMLSHSIGTFRHWFGAEADYVVYADDVPAVQADLRVPAEVLPMDRPGAEFFDDRATWKKWAPAFRHDPARTELRIDSDIFLVDDPVELREFIAGDGHDYVVTCEEFTERWPYGNFGGTLADGFTPINAGLFGQRAGADLSAAMRDAYRRWLAMLDGTEVKYHDEQGALAAILQDLITGGRARVLDPARYRVVCPLNDPPVERLDGIVGLHATYPDHPAFHRFRPEIAALSGLSLAHEA